jgi:NADH dehydrogenase
MAGLLILGGSGFVGRAVCEQLVRSQGGVADGVRVPSRRPARAQHLLPLPGVDVVRADVHDEGALGALLAGCDAAVNLVAILHGDEAEFQRVHVELPRKLAAACKAAGVRRVVHVGALGGSTDAPSLYLRTKAAGEAVLRESGLDVTVLRPSVIFGEHDRTTHLFAALQAALPLLPLAGADARVQPVWVEDVAAAIVHCLREPATIGQVYECTGPQPMTLREFVRACGRASGHRRPIVALPAALARLQARLFELLPGEPLVSRDNLASLQVPNVATGAVPGLDALGIRPASVDEVLAVTLGARGAPSRFNAWRARARRG